MTKAIFIALLVIFGAQARFLQDQESVTNVSSPWPANFTGNGIYNILNANNQDCLDIENNNLIIAPCDGTNRQDWNITQVNGNWQVVNVNTTNCAAIIDQENNGGNTPCDGSQLWNFGVDNGNLVFKNASDQEECLYVDVIGNNQTNARQVPCVGLGDDAQWQVQAAQVAAPVQALSDFGAVDNVTNVTVVPAEEEEEAAALPPVTNETNITIANNTAAEEETETLPTLQNVTNITTTEAGLAALGLANATNDAEAANAAANATANANNVTNITQPVAAVGEEEETAAPANATSAAANATAPANVTNITDTEGGR